MKVQFDTETVIALTHSPRDIASHRVTPPAPGDQFSIQVAAPGTGCVTYRVTRILAGNAVEAVVVRSTVRELTEADVI